MSSLLLRRCLRHTDNRRRAGSTPAANFFYPPRSRWSPADRAQAITHIGPGAEHGVMVGGATDSLSRRASATRSRAPRRPAGGLAPAQPLAQGDQLALLPPDHGRDP